ncbi:hypothetical protein HPB48_000724 [Haemaphysalis longicornis]|uniref:Uncharacterized protein n=1 Tax=Haemaphysalis longicornis TaxID=44386 RepID=A0A9J6FRZ4_HAELO|nr:hypothetical protein HPB48_000724 [Haemaphysalis longicornis]
MHCTPLVMLFKNPPIITWRRNKTQSPLSHEIKSRATSASKYCFTTKNIQQTNSIEAENQSAPERSEVNLRLQKAVRSGVKANGVSTEGNEPTLNNKSKAVWEAPQSVLDSRSRKSFCNVCGPLRKKIFYAFVPAFIICDYDDMVSQLSIVDYTMDKGWEREDATSLIMCLLCGEPDRQVAPSTACRLQVLNPQCFDGSLLCCRRGCVSCDASRLFFPWDTFAVRCIRGGGGMLAVTEAGPRG